MIPPCSGSYLALPSPAEDMVAIAVFLGQGNLRVTLVANRFFSKIDFSLKVS